MVRKFNKTTLIFIRCLIVEISLTILFMYLWVETLNYRLIERMWKDILNAYDEIIPCSEVETTMERLNPMGYGSYGSYENAVWVAGPDYDFPKDMHLRNDIRFRKEFLGHYMGETNRKIRFIDANLDHLGLVDRWYYWRLKKAVKKGNNGLVSQSLLDVVLKYNFGKETIKRYGFNVSKDPFLLWITLKK
ncbi:MAG: hypothetical protein NT096_00665 [Proteobacteria bacterium]|nr:hypothetical protein [Pseudomonadota bacterium]